MLSLTALGTCNNIMLMGIVPQLVHSETTSMVCINGTDYYVALQLSPSMLSHFKDAKECAWFGVVVSGFFVRKIGSGTHYRIRIAYRYKIFESGKKGCGNGIPTEKGTGCIINCIRYLPVKSIILSVRVRLFVCCSFMFICPLSSITCHRFSC